MASQDENCLNQDVPSERPKLKNGLDHVKSTFSRPKKECEYKPLNVDSEAEVARALVEIEDGLKDEEDWTRKNKSIQKLHCLALGCSKSGPLVDALARGMRGDGGRSGSVADLLAAAVGDLRSCVNNVVRLMLYVFELFLNSCFNSLVSCFRFEQ